MAQHIAAEQETRRAIIAGAWQGFDEALKRTDYYAKEVGLWGGKGAQRLRVMPMDSTPLLAPHSP